MSIDDMFLRDPRVMRLAKACGWSKYEARGRLLEVFALVYDRVDAGADDTVQAVDIDMAAEFEGLSALMIEHDLAENVRRGVRIRGAKERTNYLATRKESGQLGGIKSGESRRNKAKQQAKVTFAETEGRANPSAASASASSAVVAAVVCPAPEEKNSATPSAGGSQVGSRKKPKPSTATDAERSAAIRVLGKLSERNGVRYSGTEDHVGLIARHLRNGTDEMDLRYVVAYCAAELGWAAKPDMAPYLRPETLFGPKTLSKYLDPARTWASSLPDDRQPGAPA